MTREKRRVYHASNASVRAHAWRRNAHDELWIREDPEQRKMCAKAYRALMCVVGDSTWTSVLADARTADPAAHEVLSVRASY